MGILTWGLKSWKGTVCGSDDVVPWFRFRYRSMLQIWSSYDQYKTHITDPDLKHQLYFSPRSKITIGRIAFQ